MYKRDYTFRMNVIEEIFEIISKTSIVSYRIVDPQYGGLRSEH